MLKRFLLALAASLFTTAFAVAQVPTQVQQNPTRLDAATGYQTSAASAATITVPGISGQFIYVTALDIANCASGTIVTGAAPTSLTTTNLGGASFQIGSGSSAAGQCTPSPTNGAFLSPVKAAQQGTNVTFVLPTFATNQTVRVGVWYYYAP